MRPHGADEVPLDELGPAELVVMLARRLRQQRSAALEPFGLSPHQARAFLTVARCTGHGGELRLSGLAERLRITPRSTTEVVDALQDKGVVRRAPVPTDRRATAVVLTDQGHELLGRLHEVSTLNDQFAVLSAEQRATLVELLRLVAQHPTD